ncbi:hypothetical protein [Glutamicibacter sp. M10]|uniref:hypothetical protein n=1 Tax=Glutamicibacter sp. M10 TaxID=3023076 RepID=UPI0021C5A66C|nr:hypothetical protein [Glutamicibacter sp. M10]UXN30994.1 hypothetical protein N6V40_11230 [Glutamicibacter sp. M10]
MSANEKHAATYHCGEYTPTTEQVREACILGHYPLPSVKQRTDLGADFDRWLETVRAEAKAEALNEVANAFQYKAWNELIQGSLQDRLRVAQPITAWLRARANQYKEEPADGR